MKTDKEKKKSPSDYVLYKSWYEVEVDGKILNGVLPPGRNTEREVARISGLCGVKIIKDRPETLIKINAFTKIPTQLFRLWERAYKNRLKSLKKNNAKVCHGDK